MVKTQKENREDILVKSFLVCPNIAEVSRQTGISRTTIYETMATDSFKKKMTAAKQEALQNAVSFLQGSLSECASTLMEIVKDSDASSQVKINACQTVMQQCRAWTDTVDILGRISKLEAEMEKEKGEQSGGNYKKAVRP